MFVLQDILQRLELRIILSMMLALSVRSEQQSPLQETQHLAQRVQSAPLPHQRVSHLAQDPTRAALAGKQSLVHHQLPMAVKIAAKERISLLPVTY